jgi:rod shape determining protein RodA
LRRNVNIIKSLDWLTILLYAIFTIFGWLNIYAAVYNEQHYSILDFSQRYGVQLLLILVSFMIGAAILIIDSKFFIVFSYLFYGITLSLLLMALLFGKEVNGARAWFELSGIRIQPAEFMKVGISLAVARFMSTQNINLKRFSSLVIVVSFLILPAGIIILQNDTGSALAYICFVFVLYREGMSIGYLMFLLAVIILFFLALLLDLRTIIFLMAGFAILANYFMNKKLREVLYGILILGGTLLLSWGAFLFVKKFTLVQFLYTSLGLVAAGFLIYSLIRRLRKWVMISSILLGSIVFTYSVDYIFHHIMEPHQRKRINVLLGIEQDKKGAGYNVHQSEIAIGSGGWTGKGFLQGTQTKYNFVPEQSTDFIFCTVGEEWGFMGTFGVVGLFIFFLYRLIWLAERQRSLFTRIYGYSIAGIFFFHIAINIGMTIGLAPVIGIPLPFFSYGGSSLLAFTIMLFIFLRLDASRMETL